MREPVLGFGRCTDKGPSEEQEDATRHTELLYRKFIIFPDGPNVVLRRRGGNAIHEAVIRVDMTEGRFEAYMEGKRYPLQSFNQFLVSEFLGISSEDKLLIRHALGYQRDIDLFTGKEQDLSTLLTPADPNAMSEIEQTGPLVTPKQKQRILERLTAAIGLKEATKIPRWRAPPEEVKALLFTILKSVVALHTSSDKMEWIDLGLLNLCLQVILRNGDGTSHNTLPVKILRHLLEGNPRGAHRLGSRLAYVLASNTLEAECPGLYQLIEALISLPVFRSVCNTFNWEPLTYHMRKLFVESLGTSKLIVAYVRASVLLLGDSANPGGEVERNLASPMLSPTTSPRFNEEEYIYSDSDGEDDQIPVSQRSSRHSKSQKSDRRAPMMSPKTKFFIPKLSLPTGLELAPKTPKLNKTETKFKKKPVEELQDLAISVGESFVTSGLTSLLFYIQDDNAVTARKQNIKQTVKRRVTSGTYNDRVLVQGLTNLHDSSYYQIKCWILKILLQVAEHWEHLEYLPKPINLFYSELIVARAHPLLSKDQSYVGLLFANLANLAQYTEYRHLSLFPKLTASLSFKKALQMRKKMDLFICRVYNRLGPAFEKRDYAEMEIQLLLLSDYMRDCTTRVMSPQVSDVCMELLLCIQDFALSRGRINTSNVEMLPLVNALLSVFDQLVVGSPHSDYDSFLRFVILENRERWRYYRHYTCQVLFNKSLERSYAQCVASVRDSPTHISQFRRQIVFHFSCCLKLIKRQPPSEWGRQLRDFEFLLHPTQGYVLRILSELKGTTLYLELQRELLSFVECALDIDDGSLIRSKNYADAYIGHAYLSFIRLYHNIEDDQDTMNLIDALLRLLLSFAKQKTVPVTLKFYQLRVMDFLVHHVSLEYEAGRAPPPRPVLSPLSPKNPVTLPIPAAAGFLKKSPKQEAPKKAVKKGQTMKSPNLPKSRSPLPQLLPPASNRSHMSLFDVSKPAASPKRKFAPSLVLGAPLSARNVFRTKPKRNVPNSARHLATRNSLTFEVPHQQSRSDSDSDQWDDEVTVQDRRSDLDSASESSYDSSSEEEEETSEESESTESVAEVEESEEEEETEGTEEEEEEDEEETSSSEVVPKKKPGLGLILQIPTLQNCPVKGENQKSPTSKKPTAKAAANKPVQIEGTKGSLFGGLNRGKMAKVHF